jgi:hypothetical protein
MSMSMSWLMVVHVVWCIHGCLHACDNDKTNCEENVGGAGRLLYEAP